MKFSSETTSVTPVSVSLQAISSSFAPSTSTVRSFDHARIGMQFCLFDKDPSRRRVWAETSDTQSFKLRWFDVFEPPLALTPFASRILVIHESVLNGDMLGWVARLRKEFPQDLIVATISSPGASLVSRLMHAGACWVLDGALCSKGFQEDCKQIVAIAHEHGQKLQSYFELQANFKLLSQVEKNVLQLILAGIPNKQIAKRMAVSVRTIESRRSQIYRKFDVDTVVDLVQKVQRFITLRQVFSSETEPLFESVLEAV